MRNIKLTIEYDGTHFNGWQVQIKKRRTVQGEIEKALSKILKTKTKITGSGRTDSGVHALGQVANFNAESRLSSTEILKALNANLPQDISILKVEDVPDKFHAQYSPKSKTYRYSILNRTAPAAQQLNFSYHYPYPLNVSVMKEEAKALIGRKDFKSFQAVNPRKKSGDTIRTIKRADVKKRGDYILIELQATGFLYKMVRNIVGTLLSIGRGRLPKGSIKKILQKRNRSLAGDTAPAKGLCLVEVEY